MFSDNYGEPVARDPIFRRAQRLVALDFSAKGADIMARNPAVMRFTGRDSGILVLVKLVQMQMTGGHSEKRLPYSDIGSRFGVSRTHMRDLLEVAAEHGDVSPLRPRGDASSNFSRPSCKPSTASSPTPCQGTICSTSFARERMARE